MNEVGVPQHSLNLFFYSTPSSPRFSSAYEEYERDEREREPFSCVPFSWELTPGTPKSTEPEAVEFDFSGQLDMMLPPSLSSADQLFDAGKIRPLKPPPRLIPSPKSPKPNDNPFQTALHSSTNPPQLQLRGREIGNGMKRGSSRKGISRSLSPLRVSEFALLRQDEEEELNSSSNSRGGSKKWRLKDLFLFRSASEGTSRAGGKRYSFLSRRNSMEKDENKSSSLRSSGSGIEGSVSKRRGGGETILKKSAHEMHYTSKRAVSEELKKKTSLAYRHGLLGCLGFNPILHHFPNAFSSSPFSSYNH